MLMSAPKMASPMINDIPVLHSQRRTISVGPAETFAQSQNPRPVSPKNGETRTGHPRELSFGGKLGFSRQKSGAVRFRVTGDRPFEPSVQHLCLQEPYVLLFCPSPTTKLFHPSGRFRRSLSHAIRQSS